MRIFLSYPSEEHVAIEQVALALRNGGHHVFLDKDDLPPGLDFNEQISNAIDSSDLLIFFITPVSVAEGRFTRSELAFARKKWPGPAGHVLPVMLRPTPIEAVPAYLKAVHIFEPQGNLAAEIRSEVSRYARTPPVEKATGSGSKLWWGIGLALVLAVIAVAIAYFVAKPEATLACRYADGPKAGMTEVSPWGVPAPVGMTCFDNLGSFGTFVSNSTLAAATPIDLTRFTKTCQFNTGPRQGQSANLRMALYFLIGAACHDGAGSIGIGIKE